MNNQLPSENVVVEAPMSFTGSTKRIVPWLSTTSSSALHQWDDKGPAGKAAGIAAWTFIVTLGVSALLFWWSAIVAWYLFFGIFLIPYRLIRRSQRSGKRDALRHREMMLAVSQMQQQPGAAPAQRPQITAQTPEQPPQQ